MNLFVHFIEREGRLWLVIEKRGKAKCCKSAVQEFELTDRVQG